MLSFILLALFLGAKAESQSLETATFAGGCFWCMEPPFIKLDGVFSVESGYTGGHVKNPSYEQVSSGSTGHLEAVQVSFDPKKISYEKLLEVFWSQIDPTDANGQFVDRGEQYTTAIFYHNDDQKNAAFASKEALERSQRFQGKKIATGIRPAATFYRAEDYHQKFYQKNPARYQQYRQGSQRDPNLKKIWGDKKDP